MRFRRKARGTPLPDGGSGEGVPSIAGRDGAAAPSGLPAFPHPALRATFSHPGEGRGVGVPAKGAGNPSPGWERGRGEGLPLIAGRGCAAAKH
jgi:hypothetical protein